ncbi:MAG: Clp protease N-terminal domain-containing protein [Blastocatellia bacterium]
MFERYTEKARRVIFFARFEASQFGSEAIEAEHILLGLLRIDGRLATRFFQHPETDIEAIREKLKARAGLRARVSTNIDMPLSDTAKRALAFAAEESEALGHRHIGTEHLLLGLLREEGSLAAGILGEIGVRLADARQALADKVTTPAADEATINRPVTQKLSLDVVQPVDHDERWMQELSEACVGAGLFTPEELVSEFERVAALRQFRADAEALLRLLGAKGLVDPQQLPKLAFDLRDEKKLAEFIEKLRQR